MTLRRSAGQLGAVAAQ